MHRSFGVAGSVKWRADYQVAVFSVSAPSIFFSLYPGDATSPDNVYPGPSVSQSGLFLSCILQILYRNSLSSAKGKCRFPTAVWKIAADLLAQNDK